jgi:hypothetical protein
MAVKRVGQTVLPEGERVAAFLLGNTPPKNPTSDFHRTRLAHSIKLSR